MRKKTENKIKSKIIKNIRKDKEHLYKFIDQLILKNIERTEYKCNMQGMPRLYNFLTIIFTDLYDTLYLLRVTFRDRFQMPCSTVRQNKSIYHINILANQ